jgi:L-seryl-tRNA(Ser) seleniumtransferase
MTETQQQDELRHLPAVHELLQSPIAQQLISDYSYTPTLHAVRETLMDARSSIRSGSPCPTPSVLLTQISQRLEHGQRAHLRPLINATGVIINTNLGRAPLSLAALEAVRTVGTGYNNLEYDLELGERGSRHMHVADLLCDLTGAEAALVTNNNAAAVLLALSTLAQGCEVIISRGQLVEIGGGFRVPDVMRQSACRLVEVGTTNRTRLRDYKDAITAHTALLLTVHPSNFVITGFTESTPTSAMVELAHQSNLLVMDDLGSGCLLPCEEYGLAHEPTPQESIRAGVDLVCFSGDKLLGGPQAGILIGKAEVIARLAKHPLMRAVRIDKMTLAALEATLRHYQRAEAPTHIPVWQMIATTPDALKQRATQWVSHLRAQGVVARLQPGTSTIGGGSLPGETLPTTLLALDADQVQPSLEIISKRLRSRPIPVISRILRNSLLLDPRTVFQDQDQELLQALIACSKI